jgi:hypothetical protein
MYNDAGLPVATKCDARQINVNAVKETGGGFADAYRRDDIFIVPLEEPETVCSTIIDNFTTIALDLLTTEPR